MQEAESLLELLDEDIIRLEQESDNSELLQEIFRAAHTIKGSSGLFGLDHIVAFTHVVESALDRVRGGELAIVKASIRMHRRDDVLEGMRVYKGSVAYDIQAILPDDRNRLYMMLVCQKVVG